MILTACVGVFLWWVVRIIKFSIFFYSLVTHLHLEPNPLLDSINIFSSLKLRMTWLNSVILNHFYFSLLNNCRYLRNDYRCWSSSWKNVDLRMGCRLNFLQWVHLSSLPSLESTNWLAKSLEISWFSGVRIPTYRCWNLCSLIDSPP